MSWLTLSHPQVYASEIFSLARTLHLRLSHQKISAHDARILLHELKEACDHLEQSLAVESENFSQNDKKDHTCV